MFKKILQSLSKSQSAKAEAPKHVSPAPVAAATKPAGQAGSVLDKIAKPALTPTAPITTTAPRTPEELCDVTPKMPKEEIQARLKLLYRRYNRSASSLDPKTRSEADRMLNAIVLVREKYFGEI